MCNHKMNCDKFVSINSNYNMANKESYRHFASVFRHGQQCFEKQNGPRN